jgi:hypothetical protein
MRDGLGHTAVSRQSSIRVAPRARDRAAVSLLVAKTRSAARSVRRARGLDLSATRIAQFRWPSRSQDSPNHSRNTSGGSRRHRWAQNEGLPEL